MESQYSWSVQGVTHHDTGVVGKARTMWENKIGEGGKGKKARKLRFVSLKVFKIP